MKVPRFGTLLPSLTAVFALLTVARDVRAQLITATPGLKPAFDSNITDYTVPSAASADVQVSVNAPAGLSVSIDGQPFNTSTFNVTVTNLTAGQKFTIQVKTISGTKTYYVRRTPSDFPNWTTQRPGIPQAEYYVFCPDIRTDFGALRNYVVIADNFGVPVWWYRTNYCPIDAKLFPGGRVGWMTFGVYPGVAEVHTLDGAMKVSLPSAPVLGGNLDNHEFLQLANGNYLFIGGIPRGPVDLTAYGGSKTSTVIDNVIEEVAPNGALMWYWSAMDHIPVSETGPEWRGAYLVNSPADPWHMNSVEIDMGCRLGNIPTGPGYVISFRHLDAVVRIDRMTGAITWKLGGVKRQGSLKMVNDPYGSFGGNHDARIVQDGTLSVHDNGTAAGRAPRAVRYRINNILGTATLIEQMKDAAAQGSGCCGSARKLWGADWVTEWGANPIVTELDPNGAVVFRMSMTEPFFSYRAAPVDYYRVSRTDLRAGMDAQYPR